MALGSIWLVWQIGVIIFLPLLVSDCKGGAGVGKEFVFCLVTDDDGNKMLIESDEYPSP